jgi:cytochrome c oxidase assembly protein subunit 11
MNQHNKQNTQTALSLAMIVAGMLLLSFAAVPLYQLFCQVTGFGGTTQRAQAMPTRILEREVVVSFNADTDPSLPWQFRPTQRDARVQVGAPILASYEVVNNSDAPVTGMATYNVTPHEAGVYFHKVQCFCFEEQTLAAGQRVDMPISFYVDPAIEEDPLLNGLKHITLSYTFFNQASRNENRNASRDGASRSAH